MKIEMAEIISANITNCASGAANHNPMTAIAPSERLSVKDCLIRPRESANRPAKGDANATKNAVAPVIWDHKSVPFSGARLVVKYTANTKVACKVGTGEDAQSYNAQAKEAFLEIVMGHPQAYNVTSLKFILL